MADAEFVFIAVEPQLRRAGIGNQLIRSALDIVSKASIRSVKVTVIEQNLAVMSLLQKFKPELIKEVRFIGQTICLFRIAI